MLIDGSFEERHPCFGGSIEFDREQAFMPAVTGNESSEGAIHVDSHGLPPTGECDSGAFQVETGSTLSVAVSFVRCAITSFAPFSRSWIISASRC